MQMSVSHISPFISLQSTSPRSSLSQSLSPRASLSSQGEREREAKMASVALKEQLNLLVNSMLREGSLDDQFSQLQMLQDANNPGFVVEVISLFCDDSERILGELTKLLNQPVVDFAKVDSSVHQLKGSSSSVGAQHVKLACVEFRQFCEDKDRVGCLRALAMVKKAYSNLRTKFESMVQLERRIFAYDTKQN